MSTFNPDRNDSSRQETETKHLQWGIWFLKILKSEVNPTAVRNKGEGGAVALERAGSRNKGQGAVALERAGSTK